MGDSAEAVEALRKCLSCASSIPKSAVVCPECGISRRRRECRTCGASMPMSARFCNQCKSYRDLRRFIPITSAAYSSITALVAVIALLMTHYANFQNRQSKTSISFAGTNDDSIIYVRVANTGGNSSVLRAYKLKFGKLIDERQLILTGEPGEIRTVIPAGGEARIGLDVLGLVPARKDPKQKARYSRDDVLENLQTEKATIEIEVEESNGPLNRSVKFDAYQIATVIRNTLAAYVERR